MPVSVTYTGRLSSMKGPYTGMVIDSVLTNRRGPHSIQVTFTRDDYGQEATAFSVDGKLTCRFFLDSEGEYEIPPMGQITLRPRDESAGLPTLGFALEPGASTILSPKPNDGNKGLPGWPCSSNDSGCTNYELPIGFSGTVAQCQWHAAERTLAYSFGNVPLLVWHFRGTRNGFPEFITFEKRGDSGVVLEQAQLALGSVKHLSAPLRRDSFMKDGANLLVMKHNFGYGSEVGVSNPWSYFSKQEQGVHQRQSAAAPMKGGILTAPLVGGSAVLFSLFLGAIVLRSRKDPAQERCAKS